MSRHDEVTNTYLPGKTEGVTKLIISNIDGDHPFYFNSEHRKYVEREKWYVTWKTHSQFDEKVALPVAYMTSAENLLEIFPDHASPGSAIQFPRFLAQCAFPKQSIKTTKMKDHIRSTPRDVADFRDQFIMLKLHKSKNDYCAIDRLKQSIAMGEDFSFPRSEREI